MPCNPWVLQRNQVIEVILYNRHMTNHPVHIHGHHFQAIWRSEPGGGDFPSSTMTDDDFRQIPVTRDTIVVPNGGSVVIRFRADNPGESSTSFIYCQKLRTRLIHPFLPGVWLLHCHMEWHAETGLAATFIEAPLDLQQQQQLRHITADQLTLCTAAGIELPHDSDNATLEQTGNPAAVASESTTDRQRALRYAD